jgi:hypothetical protein
VATARPTRQLLEAAGFTQVTETECTAEFAAVTVAWLRHWEANHEALVALHGEPFVEERQARRRAQLRAVEDGILSRSLFTARRPGGTAARQASREQRGSTSYIASDGSVSQPIRRAGADLEPEASR